MPNRILKESIKLSPDIDLLSWFEEVVFYRLLVTVDDYGCFDGRTIVLKNDLFPTKDNITKKSIEDAIAKLASVGLVHPYESNGVPYLYLPTWELHQRIRNHHRKYPEPTIDSNPPSTDGQSSADCMPESNPIQSESNPNPNPNPNPNTQYEERFESWWKNYPRKIGKEAARKSWDKIKPTESLYQQMMQSVDAAKRTDQWSKNNGQYIPNPATWLNQGRWQDELSTGFVYNDACGEDESL